MENMKWSKASKKLDLCFIVDFRPIDLWPIRGFACNAEYGPRQVQEQQYEQEQECEHEHEHENEHEHERSYDNTTG